MEKEELLKIYQDANVLMKTRLFKEAKEKFEEYIRLAEDEYKDSKDRCYAFNSMLDFVLFVNREKPNYTIKSIKSNVSNAYTAIGAICFELKDFSEAKKQLNKAIEWNPYNFSAKLELGEVYKVQGEMNNFFDITLATYKHIYNEIDLARFYRNLGYYFTEKKNWTLAKAIYLYSLEFENNMGVNNELNYIRHESNDSSLPNKDSLKDILSENKVPTYISKLNIEIISGLYNELKKDNKHESAFGTSLLELIKTYEKANIAL